MNSSLFDIMLQEVDELRRSGTSLAERLASMQRLQEDVDRLNKKLNSEIMLKQQAVNKLAEIMNRYLLHIYLNLLKMLTHYNFIVCMLWNVLNVMKKTLSTWNGLLINLLLSNFLFLYLLFKCIMWITNLIQVLYHDINTEGMLNDWYSSYIQKTL